jgi:hypothetical protein
MEKICINRLNGFFEKKVNFFCAVYFRNFYSIDYFGDFKFKVKIKF